LPSAKQTLRTRAGSTTILEGTAAHPGRCTCNTEYKEDNMPILLWLLGVPLSLIIILMLFHAV